MKRYKTNMITAIIAALIAIVAFFIIYRDITYEPEFRGVFVYNKGVVRV